MWDFITATEEKNGTHDDMRFQSVLTELDLAIAFCAIATSSKDKTKTGSNIENAREAFSEGVRFLFKAEASLSHEARHEVIQKLALLNTELREQDERTSTAPQIHTPSARASDG